MKITFQSIVPFRQGEEKESPSPATKGRDMIVVYDGGNFPQGLIHIDTFYAKEDDGEQNPIYKALERGEKVTVELKIA